MKRYNQRKSLKNSASLFSSLGSSVIECSVVSQYWPIADPLVNDNNELLGVSDSLDEFNEGLLSSDWACRYEMINDCSSKFKLFLDESIVEGKLDPIRFPISSM